jgi:hypothetical protein
LGVHGGRNFVGEGRALVALIGGVAEVKGTT